MKNFVHYINVNHKNLKRLSRNLSIAEERLEELRRGHNLPSYTELRQMAKVTHLPVSFLLKEHTQKDGMSILFRRQIGSVPENIIESFNYFLENVIALNPAKDRVENLHERLPAVENTFLNAEKLAYIFRQEYFGGNFNDPLTNLPTILANKLNFIVKVFELGKSADGASAIVDGYTFILISPRFEARMLFTLAHELAHIINHHRDGDFILFDNPYNLNPKADAQKNESFANAFASALLLPEKGMGKVIEKVRALLQLDKTLFISDIEILYLARFYGVSFDVASFRCEMLGLLPPGGAYALSARIKEAHGSAEKRADELNIAPREPLHFPDAPNFILERALELIMAEEYSSGKIAEMLSMPVQSIFQYNSHIG